MIKNLEKTKSLQKQQEEEGTQRKQKVKEEKMFYKIKKMSDGLATIRRSPLQDPRFGVKLVEAKPPPKGKIH